MKFFLLFAPAFMDFPLAIVRQLKKSGHKISICGLATGPLSIYERVVSVDPEIAPLRRLDDLERQWLETPCDRVKLQELERRVGSESLRRIMIGDRHVGSGWIFGARPVNNALVRRMQTDKIEVYKRYLVGLVSYVFQTLEKERPDVVFCYAVAGAPALALYEACRALNIKFRCLSPTRIGSKMIVDNEPYGTMGPVRNLFNDAIENRALVSKHISSAREWLDRFRDVPIAPEYTLAHRSTFIKKHRWTSLLIGTLLGVGAAIKAMSLQREPNLRRPRHLHHPRIYRSIAGIRARILLRKQIFCDLGILDGQSYAYFPLQVEPEASTLVVSPFHTNQLAVIEAISKSLPVDMCLVVKEHLPMIGHRPKGFYEQILRMPGVLLVSPFEDNFALISKASLVCVITGTAAWEAMLLQRPVLIIGNSPYLALGGGSVHCSDLSRLTEAVKRAFATPPVDDEKLVTFIASIFTLSFEVPSRLLWGRVEDRDFIDSAELVAFLGERLRSAAQSSS